MLSTTCLEGMVLAWLLKFSQTTGKGLRAWVRVPSLVHRAGPLVRLPDLRLILQCCLTVKLNGFHGNVFVFRVTEFQPGVPWKGIQSADPESDPYVTPGGVLTPHDPPNLSDTDHQLLRDNTGIIIILHHCMAGRERTGHWCFRYEVTMSLGDSKLTLMFAY